MAKAKAKPKYDAAVKGSVSISPTRPRLWVCGMQVVLESPHSVAKTDHECDLWLAQLQSLVNAAIAERVKRGELRVVKGTTP